MQNMYYIELDVHKRTISYCVKDGGGKIHAEGRKPTERRSAGSRGSRRYVSRLGGKHQFKSYVEAHQGPRLQMGALIGGFVIGLMSEEDAVAFVPDLCGNA